MGALDELLASGSKNSSGSALDRLLAEKPPVEELPVERSIPEEVSSAMMSEVKAPFGVTLHGGIPNPILGAYKQYKSGEPLISAVTPDIEKRISKAKQLASEKMGEYLRETPSDYPTTRGVIAGYLDTAGTLSPIEPTGAASMLLPKAVKGMFPEGALSKRVGRAYVEQTIPSTPKEVRYDTRTGNKTAAELVIERPHLGNSREDILSRSIKGIENLGKVISQKLNNAVKSGMLQKKTLPSEPSTAELSGVKGGTLPTIELPRSEKVPVWGEWKELPDYNKEIPTESRLLEPGEQGLQTASSRGEGGKFQKGGGRGILGDWNVGETKKQTSLILEDVAKKVRDIKENFIARTQTPEYNGIKRDYAIDRNEISKAFDDVADSMGTGTEGDVIKSIGKLKKEFSDYHPQFADVQYWDDIKKQIYSLIGDENYIKQENTGKVKALKAVANRIKNSIEQVVPEVKELNREQGALIQIRNAIIQSSPKEVRDTSFLGPIKESAMIRAGRELYKNRGVTGEGGVPIAIGLQGKKRDSDESSGLSDKIKQYMRGSARKIQGALESK